MFDLFTDRARKVMALARQEAQRLNHGYLDPEHILLGLVLEDSGVASKILQNLGVERDAIRSAVMKVIEAKPTMVTMGQLPLTPLLKKVLDTAVNEDEVHLHCGYIGTEHLLIALIRVPESIAAQVLTTLGLSLEKVRDAVKSFLPSTEEKKKLPPEQPSLPVDQPNFTLTRHGVKRRIAQLQEEIRSSCSAEHAIKKSGRIAELQNILTLLPHDDDIPGLPEALRICFLLLDIGEQTKILKAEWEKGGMTDNQFIANIKEVQGVIKTTA